jgi:hypothetical protein
MAFTFPTSPAVNDTFTINNRTYTWTGTVWEMTGGVITSQQIADNAITTSMIAAGAVVEADLGTGAVTEAKIGTGAVTEAKIAANAVTQAKLASTLSGITLCTSSTRPGTPFNGQMIFETNTNKILVYYNSSWNGVSSVRKVAAFASSGTWTVPSGVTYAIAHILAGGGGIGSGTNAGNGGTSSVAFASGTVSATGGNAANINFGGGGGPNEKIKVPGAINSGYGAKLAGSPTNYVDGERFFASAGDGARVTAGADVTPGASISVTVGGGGAAGTYGAFTGASGGSGYVWIEYEV